MIWCIKTFIIAYVKTQKNKIYYPLCQIYSPTNKGMFLLRVLIREKHFDTDCHQVLEKVPCVWKQEPHQVQNIAPQCLHRFPVCLKELANCDTDQIS